MFCVRRLGIEHQKTYLELTGAQGSREGGPVDLFYTRRLLHYLSLMLCIHLSLGWDYWDGHPKPSPCWKEGGDCCRMLLHTYLI